VDGKRQRRRLRKPSHYAYEVTDSFETLPGMRHESLHGGECQVRGDAGRIDAGTFAREDRDETLESLAIGDRSVDFDARFPDSNDVANREQI
jgi:hypothetical protein